MQNYANVIPQGRVDLEKWSANGEGPVERTSIQNLVVDSGRISMVNLMLGQWDQNSAISYHAVGTGSAKPTADNTALQYETGRKFVIRSADGFNARAVIFYDTTELNGTGYEQGLFLGSGAGYNSANSGVLVARVTGQFTKSNTQNMRVVWSILMASATAGT